MNRFSGFKKPSAIARAVSDIYIDDYADENSYGGDTGNGAAWLGLATQIAQLGGHVVQEFGPQNSGIATNPAGRAVLPVNGIGGQSSNGLVSILLAVIVVIAGLFAFGKLKA